MKMRKGFTLVELLVVVIIIGILALVGIPQYRKALERAKGAEAYSGLGHIQEGEKIFYVINEKYESCSSPITTASCPLDITLPESAWTFNVTGGVDTFTATTTRKSGPCQGKTITIDQAGTITDAWKACVDGL